MSSDPVHIRVRDLHKSYGGEEVLRGISFDLLRGRSNLIIGPSGAGKSVLMRQLIRLERPDRGQILIDGEDIVPLSDFDLMPIRRRFGMVFQMSALFDSLTVFDNVAFPLREHGRLPPAEVRERVMQRLTDLKVDHAAQRMPSEISGGMQKRVALARALVLETSILIYDEPTTGLDPISTQAVDDLIVETQQKFRVTTIVISHDMASVFRIADHIHFLADGRLLESGTPQELLRSQEPKTVDFLRASGLPMRGEK